ncbi:hypothetical protein RRG08_029399 [Elysia crispata]|uniref:Uncharacterized protein n=1 Tax=Elysia crispata TaxID=231223 RepID=A0AAE1D7N6_9GAST|nr:hypothetical protein RRG08_029399 [Elysia crispata]
MLRDLPTVTNFRRCCGVPVMAGQKKNCQLVDTVHNRATTMSDHLLRYKAKPVAIQDYILNIAGSARSDQLKAYFSLERRSITRWKNFSSSLYPEHNSK